MGAVTFKSSSHGEKHDITIVGNFTLDHKTRMVKSGDVSLKLKVDSVDELIRKMPRISSGGYETVGG